MGFYEITQFSQAAQQVIREKNIDKDKNGKIDNNELQELLSNVDEKLKEDILGFVKEEKTDTNYETNSKNNSFLKEYLEGKAKKNGINIPENLEINVSSPKEFSNEYKNLLRYVRTEIYGARVADMFNLLTKDNETVKEKVQTMKISDEDKQKILQLKNMFDKYYKIEIAFDGQSIDLLNISKDDEDKLKKVSPEFADFIKEEADSMRKNATKFAQKEIEAVELSSAGESSRDFIPTLLTILGCTTGYGIAKSVWDNHQSKKDYANFIKEMRATSRQKIGFVNPFTDIAEKIQKNRGSKLGIAMALLGTLFFTAAGSIDDVCGCVKDYKQDKDNFGESKAKTLAYISGAAGIATSFLVGSTMDNIGDINRAKTVKKKEFFKTLSNEEKVRAKNLMRKFGPSKLKQFGKLGTIAGLGMLIASCSSGSSWTSMAGTRLFFGQNGDELVKKNIISEEENSFKNTNANMMKYEAYKGKWRGIAVGPTSDPVLGSTFATSGLLFNANPFVSSLAFGVQGCSETLTACAYQLTGDDVRESVLDKEKKALVASVQ